MATSRLANPRPRDVEAPLRLALKLADRAEASRAEIGGMLGIPGPPDSIRGFIGHVRHRADLTGRRILKGGTIPHRGKVHPISGPHTRWTSKGKAGVPVEPGVPVRVPEDRHRFIPHHSVMWEGSDVDVAVPMGAEARARFPDLSVVSFDRGLHSPSNRLGPAGMLELNAMPRKGRLSKADRVRESGEAFRGARRAHAAGGSAINSLEHRGLDRVRSHGKKGFAGAVALAVLAANVHRPGLMPPARERPVLPAAA